MDSECHGSPRDAVWGPTSFHIRSEPTQRPSRCHMLRMVLQRKECDCGRVNVRLKRGAEHDAISCVPSPSGACAIQEHLRSQSDPLGGPWRGATTKKPLE